MAFGTVDRNNGDTWREQDIDQFQANDDHLRAETDFRVLANVFDLTSGDESNNSADTHLQAEVSGVTLVTDGVGENHVADVDISSLSEGIHVLEFSMNTTTWKLRFVKTSDVERISIWWDHDVVSNAGSYSGRLNWFTVIGHREDQYW